VPWAGPHSRNPLPYLQPMPVFFVCLIANPFTRAANEHRQLPRVDSLVSDTSHTHAVLVSSSSGPAWPASSPWLGHGLCPSSFNIRVDGGYDSALRIYNSTIPIASPIQPPSRDHTEGIVSWERRQRAERRRPESAERTAAVEIKHDSGTDAGD
jgi:hypothetical protein